MELETNIQTNTPTTLKPSLRSRMKRTISSRLRSTYVLDTRFWRIAQSGVWASCCFMFAITALSLPTGLGTSLDIFMFITIGTLGFACSAALLAFLLALLRVPIPRLFTGGVLFNLTAFYFMLWIPGSGVVVSIVLSVILTSIGILLGYWIALVTSEHIKIRTKWTLTLTLCVLSSFVVTGFLLHNQSDVTFVHPISDREIFNTIPLASPAESGVFATQYFTYGSGYDWHRQEYGPEVELKSSSVDASTYIDKWPSLRTLFWGFDQKALPLNGRVWMPTGTGPFPLVLMVHGNHLMEDFSDEGYGYLGELLASRGYITISVDENFLNYSVWSNIPENDIKIRSWLLLKHLQQLQTFSEQPGSLFYQKVDFEQIALIGHSRGGQAVAMAADANRWFLSDPTLKEDLATLAIKAVVALAPTDSSVDQMQAKLRNVSYMVLQGSRDGDLNEYFGERQYDRASFASDDVGFKTYLHIANANHSQFNTTWGGLDTSLPKGLFLNRKQMMTGADQRQVTKVYVSAFLETVLNDAQDYKPLFRDYRAGRHWLPDSIYYNRFEDAKFTALARYDEDEDRTSLLIDGIAEASDGLRWTEESTTIQNKSVLLETSEHNVQESSYSLSWDEENMTDIFAEAEGISLSIADQSAVEDGVLTSGDILPIADVDITLDTSNGVSVALPLSQFMNLQPMIIPQFTKHQWFEKYYDKGKYNLPEKAIFQTVELPFDEIQKVNPNFKPALIHRITLRFNLGPSRILLDDVGLYRN